MATTDNEGAAKSIIEAYITAAESVECNETLKAMCSKNNGIETSALIAQIKKMGDGPFTLKDHIVAYLSAHDAKKKEKKAAKNPVAGTEDATSVYTAEETDKEIANKQGEGEGEGEEEAPAVENTKKKEANRQGKGEGEGEEEAPAAATETEEGKEEEDADEAEEAPATEDTTEANATTGDKNPTKNKEKGKGEATGGGRRRRKRSKTRRRSNKKGKRRLKKKKSRRRRRRR